MRSNDMPMAAVRLEKVPVTTDNAASRGRHRRVTAEAHVTKNHLEGQKDESAKIKHECTNRDSNAGLEHGKLEFYP